MSAHAGIPLQSMSDGVPGVTHAHVHVDVDDMSAQPRYRKNRAHNLSSHGSGGLRSPENSLQRHSYHGTDERDSERRSEELMTKLPSRQLATQVKQVLSKQTVKRKSNKKRPGYHTLRLHGEIQAEIAAEELSHDQDFMNRSSEDQLDAIRHQYPGTSMAGRREIQAIIQEKGPDKKPGCFKRMRYSMQISLKKFRSSLAELRYSLELWRIHFKTIEGHFGTGVTSYFLFLKWLFLLNIPVFILTFSFVVVPQLMYRYIVLGNGTNPYADNVKFTGVEILTGGGWFNDTELYYGAYTNETINIVGDYKYYMQYAYLCTNIVYYIIILIATMVSLSRSYRKNFVESSQEFGSYYVTKVFTWDYSLYEERSAKLKQKSVFKEFQEYLSVFRQEETVRGAGEWCSIILLRIFTNLLILGLLAGSAYLIWYISVTMSLLNDIPVLTELALPLLISAVNFILPFAFSIIGSFEKYRQPQVEQYMTMVRTIVLNVCTLGVVIYFWFTNVNCSQRLENEEKWLDVEYECTPCWETFIGTQIYMLVIVDFIFILVFTFISEFVRKIMTKFCCISLGYPEFNIGRNTLNLIYSQMLVWVGLFYSPLLSLIHIVKLLVIFYVKRFSATQNCVPSVKPWRGGRTHTYILLLMFVALLLSLFAVGYSIVFLTPSMVCGPFIGESSSYQVIAEAVDDWIDSNPDAVDVLNVMLDIITSFFFIVALFILLCVVAHWSRIVAKAHEERIKLLRHQITLEGQDKSFLLNLLKKVMEDTPLDGRISSDLEPPHLPNESIPTLRKSPKLGGDLSKEGRKFVKEKKYEDSFLGPASQYRDSGSSSNNNNKQPAPYPGTSQGVDITAQNSGGREAHNLGYLNQSVEFDNTGAASMNPGYSNHSPTTKPNLPYPGRQYSGPQ